MYIYMCVCVCVCVFVLEKTDGITITSFLTTENTPMVLHYPNIYTKLYRKQPIKYSEKSTKLQKR